MYLYINKYIYIYLRRGTPSTELATLLSDTFDDEERVMGTPVISEGPTAPRFLAMPPDGFGCVLPRGGLPHAFAGAAFALACLPTHRDKRIG